MKSFVGYISFTDGSSSSTQAFKKKKKKDLFDRKYLENVFVKEVSSVCPTTIYSIWRNFIYEYNGFVGLIQVWKLCFEWNKVF